MADPNPFQQSANPFASEEPNPFAEPPAPPAEPAEAPSLSGSGTGDAFNPFYEGRQANPFGGQSQESSNATSFGPNGASAFHAATTQAIEEPPFSSGGGSKEEALARKERELEKRLKEVQRREEAVSKGLSPGEREKNFPPYFPMVYHNIEEDIPEDKQKCVKMCFYCYLGIVICLGWNFVALTVAMLAGETSVAAWLWSCIYMGAGVPGAWYLWYQRLYEACRGDRALSFAFFFLAFACHVAFVVWCALAPEFGHSEATTGLFSVFSMMEDNTTIGIFYLVGCVCWGLEATLSVWVMKLTYRMFRGGGYEEKLQGEALAAGAQASAASRV